MSLNELDNLSDAPDLHQIGSMPNPRKRKATFDVDDLPLQPAHPSPTPSSPTATPKRQRLALKAPVTAPTHIAPNNVPAALPPALPPTPQTRTRKTGRKDRLATDPINVSVYDLRKFVCEAEILSPVSP